MKDVVIKGVLEIVPVIAMCISAVVGSLEFTIVFSTVAISNTIRLK